jgi:putative tryptophan/tyrosine transport system substrate-binding protein
MRRRTVLGAALLMVGTVAAPSRAARPRIGLLASESLERKPLAGLVQGLRELGRVPGQTIEIDHVTRGGGLYLERERAAIAMVQAGAQILVTWGFNSTKAAMAATRSLPIVAVTGSDPVAAGFVRGLSSPGTNVTGLAMLSQDLASKRLQILREAIPGLHRVAVLSYSSISAGTAAGVAAAMATARTLGLQPIHLDIKDASELEAAFAEGVRAGADGLKTNADLGLATRRATVIALAARHRLPAIYPDPLFVEDGGLMSYGPDYTAAFHRAAFYVDRLLKGDRPETMPMEQRDKIELRVNLKTLAALGLALPPTLLARADEVIE